MKDDYCNCRQGRDPCTCNKPMSNGEWSFLALCMLGVFLIICVAAVT